MLIVLFCVFQDKSGIPWWLGLSHKGISLYDYADKKTPRHVSNDTGII